MRIAKQVKAEVKNSNLQFEEKLADNIKEDKKSFLCMSGANRRLSQLGILLSADGTVMENPADVANEFNR